MSLSVRTRSVGTVSSARYLLSEALNSFGITVASAPKIGGAAARRPRPGAARGPTGRASALPLLPQRRAPPARRAGGVVGGGRPPALGRSGLEVRCEVQVLGIIGRAPGAPPVPR